MKIRFLNETYNIYLREDRYGNGRLAIRAYIAETGEPFGTITTNLPDEELGEGEFFVKTYSENVWVHQLIEQEVFEELPGRYVSSGFVEIATCKKGKNYVTKTY